MKKLFVCLFIACHSILLATAQSDKEAVKSIVERYFDDIQKKGIKSSLAYIHPKIFELAPREKIEKSMEEIEKDTTIKISMSNLNIKSISKTLTIKEVKYVLAKYTYKMTVVTFSTIPEPESIEEELEKKGAEKVEVENKGNTSNMDIDATMFVIYDAQYKDWKIIEKKESTKKLFQTFLSKKEIDKLYGLE